MEMHTCETKLRKVLVALVTASAKWDLVFYPMEVRAGLDRPPLGHRPSVQGMVECVQLVG